MSDTSKEIILEYKDQVRLLREEVAELQDAGKTKDAANKRCLQKLENTNEDLERSNKRVKELEDKLKEIKPKEKE
jgi:chromosome segregation ATPase|tara:strand:- start:425 stop:649 length:225 start_codon:yes stop_codon:yes gene_type:complete